LDAVKSLFDPVMLRRAWRRRCASTQLHRAGGHVPQAGPLVFAVVRNEALRLPRFLAHYRELGAAGFVVVENNSSDATLEILTGQPDVVLYRTSANFVRKEAWLDLLLRRHGTNRWCVVVDADELLDFPGSAELGLAGLAAYLEAGGWNTLHAVLLDLYPPGSVGSVDYQAGDDYRDYEWYFDPMTSLRRVPRVFWKGSGLDYRFEGGVRERVFGVSNCCSKFPFFKFDRGMFLHDGQHYLEGAHIGPMRGVLYHFKYLQDFIPHAREEVGRGQHWQGAAEYRRYSETAQAAGDDLVLKDERSVRFEDGDQMETEGVMLCPDDLAGRIGRKAVKIP
jgi:glycosyltransferase involved in cell wall biosynthesis